MGRFELWKYKTNMKKVSIILGIVLWSAQVWAATYYIDPTCSSSGDGTTTTCGAHGPFKTWTEVTWAAGNTYSQKGGTTYFGTITIGASGTSESNRVIISSYGTGKAILDGGIIIASGTWTPNDPVKGVYSHASLGYGLYQDSYRMKRAAGSTCLDAPYFYDWYSGSKSYYRPTRGAISDHLIEQSRNYGVNIGTHDYITISGLKIQRYNYGIYGGASSGTETNSYITITNNDFYDLHFGVWINAFNTVSTGVKVTNNTFDYVRMSFEAQSYGDCKGGTVNFDSYEIAYNKITNGNFVPGPDKLKWEPDLNNLNWDEEGFGFQALTNSNVHDNYISGYIRGIVLFVCAGLDAYNNNFYNNYIFTDKNPIQFDPAINAKSFYNNKAYYNILIGGTYDGFAGTFKASNVTTPVASYNYIYNNTLIGGTNGIVGTATMDYYKIKNNIYYQQSNSLNYIANSNIHFEIDNNIYKGTRSLGNFHGASTPSAKTWDQWKALTFSPDAKSYNNTDPEFTNAAGGDYTLTSSSPAKWTGMNVGLTNDCAGQPVHNPPSIGAYEYVGIAPPKALRLVK